VDNVGILDCPPDYNEYSVYMPGEFVLTNLGFAYDNPALAEKSLIAMIKRNVAGIAVKTVYGAPISDLVRQTSEGCGVPVYVYDGAYHEIIAYQSLDLIQRDRREQDKGKVIDEVLALHDGDSIRKSLYSIVGVAAPLLQCFALAPQKNDNCSLYAILGSVTAILSSVKDSCDTVEAVSICRYHTCILAFVSYGTSAADIASVEDRCLMELEPMAGLYCGTSEAVALQDGDLAIRQSLAAMESARLKGRHLVRWPELHMSAFAEAARSDRLFMSVSRLYRSMLAQYDKEHSTELVGTAEALAYLYGDVAAVADHLYLHPNTVRYRMHKMKAVLGVPDESDKLFISLLRLTFLPVLDLGG